MPDRDHSQDNRPVLRRLFAAERSARDRVEAARGEADQRLADAREEGERTVARARDEAQEQADALVARAEEEARHADVRGKADTGADAHDAEALREVASRNLEVAVELLCARVTAADD